MTASGSDRKTHRTQTPAREVIEAVTDERRRDDSARALDLMQRATGAEPVVWSSSIIGFGRQPYTTADGKEREWFAVGLSPRKAALTLYGLTYDGTNDDLLAELGPHTTGKGCLYIKRWDDVDESVLDRLIRRAWETNHEPPPPE